MGQGRQAARYRGRLRRSESRIAGPKLILASGSDHLPIFIAISRPRPTTSTERRKVTLAGPKHEAVMPSSSLKSSTYGPRLRQTA